MTWELVAAGDGVVLRCGPDVITMPCPQDTIGCDAGGDQTFIPGHQSVVAGQSALSGRTHDLTAARGHRIVKTCARLRIPALADLAHTGAGGTFVVPIRRKPGKELTPGQRSLNRAHARFRYPVERGAATLKRWRIYRHARCSPNWLTSTAKAALGATCLGPCGFCRGRELLEEFGLDLADPPAPPVARFVQDEETRRPGESEPYCRRRRRDVPQDIPWTILPRGFSVPHRPPVTGASRLLRPERFPGRGSSGQGGPRPIASACSDRQILTNLGQFSHRSNSSMEPWCRQCGIRTRRRPNGFGQRGFAAAQPNRRPVAPGPFACAIRRSEMAVTVPFVVTTLGAAPVIGVSAAWDINERGDVVGEGDETGFVWRPVTPNGTTGAVTRLSPLSTGGAPTSAAALAINSSGDVVGRSEALDAFGNPVDRRAVLWPAGGFPVDLGTLVPTGSPTSPGFLGNSEALDINDNREVVGQSDTATSGTAHAFLSLPGQPMADLALTPLDILPPGATDFSQASGIANGGGIVGEGTALDVQGNVVSRAFFSSTASPFTRTALGTLQNGSGGFLGDSRAVAVENAFGRIAGDSVPPAGGTETTPVMFKLGPFGIDPTGLAPTTGSTRAFSDAGVIVGFVGDFGDPGRRGFAFDTSDSTLTDLSSNLATPGFTILEATGVNNSGQMSAIAADAAGVSTAVLLTPQP
ncbi:transposase family protein [Kitasatospora sp. NPDC057542]|uniref:transposase family protein n=1 Tax=Kitasatospora sp. NPDC057542 TaxID=3346162 RepID=UPI0036C336B2